MALAEVDRREILSTEEDLYRAQTDAVAPLINGDASGKNLLSMYQFTESDLYQYIEDSRLAEQAITSDERGFNWLPRAVLKAVMQQPSTRTGGSMTTAMDKLGGVGELISGMQSSSEAKGESPAHTWVAFATQSDILGIRSKDEQGPRRAAEAIAESQSYGKLWKKIPVINLGNGIDEHPTQGLGDLYTIAKWRDFDRLDGVTVAMVGDHERYRAFHSDMIGAAALGMNVIAVESYAAPVPDEFEAAFGRNFARTDDLDWAMREADVLIVGRNPDEYTGEDAGEQARSRWLAADYAGWVIDRARLQQMRPDSIVLHPRPIKDEIRTDVESDPRMWDVDLMHNLVAVRMAIVAAHMGRPLSEISKVPSRQLHLSV